MEKTSIQVSPITLERLKMLKRYGRESYDEILNKLIEEYEDDELTGEEIEEIQLVLEEIKRGETVPIEKVAKEFGIILK